MTSPRSDKEPKWDSPLLELIERAWWLIGTRGRDVGGRLHLYQGSTYKIIEDQRRKTFNIICMKTATCGRSIYFMTADDGPGLCTSSSVPYELARILRGMRTDMVLDELAMI